MGSYNYVRKYLYANKWSLKEMLSMIFSKNQPDEILINMCISWVDNQKVKNLAIWN